MLLPDMSERARTCPASSSLEAHTSPRLQREPTVRAHGSMAQSFGNKEPQGQRHSLHAFEPQNGSSQSHVTSSCLKRNAGACQENETEHAPFFSPPYRLGQSLPLQVRRPSPRRIRETSQQVSSSHTAQGNLQPSVAHLMRSPPCMH